MAVLLWLALTVVFLTNPAAGSSIFQSRWPKPTTNLALSTTISGGNLLANRACNNAQTCGVIASVKGDPVLAGFDNRTFEFCGRAGANYTLLVGEMFTVNMQLVTPGPGHIRQSDGEGTFVGGVGVNLVRPLLGLVAYVDRHGNLTFAVDGVYQDVKLPTSFHQDVVTYQPNAPGFGQLLTIRQPPFQIELVAVKPFRDELSGYNRGHFNLQAGLTEPVSSRFWGVLGETLYEHPASRAVNEARFAVPLLSYKAPAGPMHARRLLHSLVSRP